MGSKEKWPSDDAADRHAGGSDSFCKQDAKACSSTHLKYL